MKYPRVIEHTTYEHMYYVQWSRKDISPDFYNKTWAMEHIRRFEEGERKNEVFTKYTIDM